jgi:secreted PhoX family phosphatase
MAHTSRPPLGTLADRRTFLLQAAAVSAGFLRLGSLLQAAGQPVQGYRSQTDLYGALVPDPHRILDLPPGFTYRVLSRHGDSMDDGFKVPAAMDGMAAFPAPGGRTLLIRNHELDQASSSLGAFGPDHALLGRVPADRLYDAGVQGKPYLGGTTTLIFNPRTLEVDTEFLSLAGTSRNCAGGPTPWGSWITCEETTVRAGDRALRDHGYNFEVPASLSPSLTVPVPLTAMGRFNHEAIAVDPFSGVVYQTEDESNGLIYRFVPRVPGRLHEGGWLQALALRDHPSADTRRWKPEKPFPFRERLAVHWIPLEEIDNPGNDLRIRGARAGAAVFARGEGMWYGNGEVYFACTNGGTAQKGQVFRYRPSPHEGTPEEDSAPGQLELFIEPNDADLLEYGDNLTVAPWGDLVLCEDGASTQYLRGVTLDGRIYALGRNAFNNSEFTGACFDPVHPILYVNIQNPGLTLAITGPWRNSIATGRPSRG